jgi:hypothetical protein
VLLVINYANSFALTEPLNRNIVSIKTKVMRKGIAESRMANTQLSLKALQALEQKGYKYVQIKGLTADKHYDYVEPYYWLLVPMKELPVDPTKRDIYEPINSDILKQWAMDISDTQYVISDKP